MPAFAGKVALVTGGAAGIGEAAALAFARAGARLVIADIDPKGATVAGRIAADGGEAAFRETDVASAEACQDLVDFAVERFGRLDIAFNNVGVVGANPGAGAILTAQEWDRVLSVSLSSTFYCLRAELAVMMPAGGGVIINTASIAGMVSLPGKPAYVAAKHGIVGLTKAVCDDYAAWNIRCNAVAPGLVETPGLRASIEKRGGAAGDRFSTRIPMARMATAEEIAAAVLWLASDAAAYVNGVTLPVDGGFLTR